MTQEYDPEDDTADHIDPPDIEEDESGLEVESTDCADCGEPTFGGECVNQLCPECPDYIGDPEDDAETE